jgi:dihydrofolate reductase
MMASLQRRSVVLGVMIPAAMQCNFPVVPSTRAAAAAIPLPLRRPATTVYCATSLDGFLARPDGALDWLPPPPNTDGNDPNTGDDDLGFSALQAKVDGILMGRKTFEVVAAFDGPWPYSKPLTVISSTLTAVPARLQDKVVLASEDPREVLKRMSRQGAQRIYVDGGTLITSLLREDAIDEMILTTGVSGATSRPRSNACAHAQGTSLAS